MEGVSVILIALAGWHPAVASWYGPGLMGNTMGCGGRLTATVPVVAHKTLPCGLRVTIAYGGRFAHAVVGDRGPFVAGRDFDLGPEVRARLGFDGVHAIRWSRGWR